MADEPDEQTTIKAIWDESARVYSTRYPGCELRLSPDHYQPIPALTQRETAEVMTRRGYPMSQQRVDRIERKALRKLSKAIKELESREGVSLLDA